MALNKKLAELAASTAITYYETKMGRVRAERLSLFLDQVSLPFPPN